MLSGENTDITGLETLKAFEQAPEFNNWMFDSISSFITGNVIEIGSGIGNISELLFRAAESVHLTDVNTQYCQILHEKFSSYPKFSGLSVMDLADPGFEMKHSHLFNSFDSLVALNVIEHIENDSLAITNASRLLKKDGNLVILVPAFPWLFNRFDKELHHFRRYTKTSLKQLIQLQMPVVNLRYFNAVGIAGWFLSGTVMRRKLIPANQIRLYNQLVPLVSKIDLLVNAHLGLSVIGIGKNSGADPKEPARLLNQTV